MEADDIRARQAERARGQDAQRILEEPLLKEALAEMEKRIVVAWISTGPAHKETREELYNLLKGQELFEQILTRHLTTGKLAGTKLDEEEIRQRAKIEEEGKGE